MKMCHVIVVYLVLISHEGSSRKGNRDSQFDGQSSEERLNCVELELAPVR